MDDRTGTSARPLLAEARKAGDDFLADMVRDDRLTAEAATGLATTGFTVTTRVLADMRVKDGLSPEAIADAWQRRLDRARRDGDARGTVAAAFALAVWGGMQRDLADYLSSTETRNR